MEKKRAKIESRRGRKRKEKDEKLCMYVLQSRRKGRESEREKRETPVPKRWNYVKDRS